LSWPISNIIPVFAWTDHRNLDQGQLFYLINM